MPLICVLAGSVLVTFLLRRYGWTWFSSILAGLALGPGVGLGLPSLAFFFWVFLGYPPPNRWILTCLTVILALPLFWVVLGRPRSRAAAPPSSLEKIRLGKSEILALILVAVSLGMLIASFPQISDCRQFGYWDARAVWNVRALTLYRSPGDLSETFAAMTKGHPGYPLLLPAAIAAQYTLLGEERQIIPQMIGFLFTIALGSTVFFAVARVGSLLAGASATAILWMTPTSWLWGFSQYADVPFSYFLLASAVALSSQLDEHEENKLPPVFAGLFLGLLAWTKNEGLILALLLIGVYAVSTIRDHGAWREKLREVAWIGMGALPAAAALVLFKLYWAPGSSEVAKYVSNALSRALIFERWVTVAQAFWNEFNPFTVRAWGGRAWGVVWPFLVVCAILPRRVRPEMRRSLAMIGWSLALLFSFYFMVYVLTHYGLEWHLETSIDRLLFHLLPLALVWVLAGVGAAAGFRATAVTPRPFHGKR